MKTYIIDTDAQPKIPYEGWTIESHKGMGKVKWKPESLELYLSEKQKDGRYINGNRLRQELEELPILNACILDFLEEHPELTPESWKKDENGNTRYIYFWGTIFCDSHGSLYVRYWCWRDGAWRRSYDWLGSHWGGQSPALVLASAKKSKTLPSDTQTLALRVTTLEAQVAALAEWAKSVSSFR